MKLSLLLYGTAAYLIWDMLIRKKNVTDDYEDYINVGKNLTFSDYRYKEFCDVLYYAMDNPGTDEDAIFGVIKKMKTSADIRKLKETWGGKGYTGGISGNLGELLNPDVTLSGWFSLEGVLPQVNAILKNKGITERF